MAPRQFHRAGTRGTSTCGTIYEDFVPAGVLTLQLPRPQGALPQAQVFPGHVRGVYEVGKTSAPSSTSADVAPVTSREGAGRRQHVYVHRENWREKKGETNGHYILLNRAARIQDDAHHLFTRGLYTCCRLEGPFRD